MHARFGFFFVLFLGGLLLVLAAAPAAAQEGEEWQFSLTPYAWLANLDGQITAAGRTVEVDAGVSDLLDNAELAGAARFEAYRGKWLIVLDGFFFGAGVGTERPPADVDVDSFLAEASVGYRLREGFALTLGARSNSLDTRIDFQGPFLTRVEVDQDWIDPTVGFRAAWGVPGAGVVGLLIGDVGGFGAGSDFAWNLAGFLLVPAGQRTSFAVGFRILDIGLLSL